MAGRRRKEELLSMIKSLIEDLKSREQIVFRVYSIQKSVKFDPYRDMAEPQYRTEEGIFEELAKYRYRFPVVNEFFNKIFEILKEKIISGFPEDVRRVIERGNEYNVYTELRTYVKVSVPVDEIIPLLEELYEKVEKLYGDDK